MARRRTILAFPSRLSRLDSPVLDVVMAPMNVEVVRNQSHYTPRYCIAESRSEAEDGAVVVENTLVVLLVLHMVVLLIAEVSHVAPDPAPSGQAVWGRNLDK